MSAATTATDAPVNLAILEEQLRSLSHDDEALRIIQSFADDLSKTKHRQAVFNAKGALVREPIVFQDVLEGNLISSTEDAFTLLQGDSVQAHETVQNLH